MSRFPLTPPISIDARPAHLSIDGFGAEILRAVPPVLDLYQDTAICLSLFPVEGDLTVETGLQFIQKRHLTFPQTHPLEALSETGGKIPEELLRLTHLLMMSSSPIARACMPALECVPQERRHKRFELWVGRTVAFFRPPAFYDASRDYSDETAIFTPSAPSAHEALRLAAMVKEDYARFAEAIKTREYAPEFSFPTPGSNYDAD